FLAMAACNVCHAQVVRRERLENWIMRCCYQLCVNKLSEAKRNELRDGLVLATQKYAAHLQKRWDAALPESLFNEPAHWPSLLRQFREGRFVASPQAATRHPGYLD